MTDDIPLALHDEETERARAESIRQEAAEIQAVFKRYMQSIPDGKPEPAAYLGYDSPSRHWYD
jgi:hypothetical protein